MNLPYLNSKESMETRVEDLLSRMTLEEKIGQLTQYFYLGGTPLPEGFDIESLPVEQRAYIEQPKLVEAAIIRGDAGSALFVRNAKTANRLQRLAIEETRLGVPLLFGFDLIHGLRTIFPVPIAMAASWSPGLVERIQRTAAREARAVGISWAFSPNVDIARDGRWGRIVEGSGEDPVLASAMAAAQVKGFQGDLGAESVLAGPKHFAGYGAARGGRDYDDVEISDSEFYNVYLPPFRAAVDAGARNVMSAYMELNGVPASGNRWLLTDVLRGELGFDGFVVSDANAVKSLETQHFAIDAQDAAVRAVSAGLDMEMCIFDPAFQHLADAVRNGNLDESTITEAARRVVTEKFRLGLFERPYVDEINAEEVLENVEHRTLAQHASEESIVLLKNRAATLPLRLEALQSVAMIGQLADSKRDTLGPWVFDYDLDETVTLLQGLRSRLEGQVEVAYASGAGIPERPTPSMFDMGEGDAIPRTPKDYDDDTEITAAVELAARSDLAIVVVGQRQNQVGESASVSTLDLPGRQLEQLQRIVATGTTVVVIVMSGRPLDLRWADANVPAILQAWYPGSRGGDAVAAVLVGDVSPSARLPFVWPRHAGHLPLNYAHLRTFAPENQDKRYWDDESLPLYPFGHGLSYAAFTYDNLTVEPAQLRLGETATVTVDVTNTSAVDAQEVVQLYIHQRHGQSSRPVRELKAFEKLQIPAGTTSTVTFEIGPKELRYWSAVSHDWTQDVTVIDLWAGTNSTATLAVRLDVLRGN